jgi:hypothetical protein
VEQSAAFGEQGRQAIVVGKQSRGAQLAAIYHSQWCTQHAL